MRTAAVLGAGRQDIRCGHRHLFPRSLSFLASSALQHCLTMSEECLQQSQHIAVHHVVANLSPAPACSVDDDCYCLYCDCLESVWCLLYKLSSPSPEQKTLSKHYEHYDGLESRPAEHNYSSPGHHGRGASDPRQTAAPAQQLI